MIEYAELHLISYGKDSFDIKKFQRVQNRPYWNKPRGGLWASPVNTKWGWKEWCEAEDFCVEALTRSFRFRFMGRILTIDSKEDLLFLSWIRRDEMPRLPYVDFEELVNYEIDAIFLTVRGEAETRLSHPENLYGWDCECALILNPDGIMTLETQHEKT